jgi:hypothetical protein
MFTRANFDINHTVQCTVCKNSVATRISTNTVSTPQGFVISSTSAFCINCWNETMEDKE